MKYLEILNLHKLALAGALVFGIGATASAQQSRTKQTTEGLTPRVEKPAPTPAPKRDIEDSGKREINDPRARHKTARKQLSTKEKEVLKRIAEKKADKP